MKSVIHLLFPLLLSFLACTASSFAADSAAGLAGRARLLQADVKEFATVPGLSRAKREKRIATAVRTAVVAATAYVHDPEDVLGAASELAAAASRAAPAFTEVIIQAVSLAPGVTRVDGAASHVRSAALAGAKGLGGGRRTVAAQPRRVQPTERMEPVEPEESDRPAAVTRRAAGPALAEDGPAGPEERRIARHNAVRDQQAALTLTTDVGVKHDDNVFLSPTNEVGDTVVSVTPGVAMRWESGSALRGNLAYKEAFNRYVEKSSPNVSLGVASLAVGYEGAASTASLDANYQQLNQSNADVLASGHHELLRINLTGAGASYETSLWTKTGLRLGASYADTRYGNSTFLGNRQWGLPIDLLFRVTPKTSLSLGYVHSSQRADGGGATSNDDYYNLGARGAFTEKLSGSFNIGYQSRRIATNPNERMLAFAGLLDYALTPKTGLTLGLTRNFNASALGASTRNTAFRLGLKSDLSNQWQLGAHVSWLDNEYGPAVFRTDTVKPDERTDHTWEADISATYLINDWFSTSASYLLRHNRSTLQAVDFSSNVVGLTMGLKY